MTQSLTPEEARALFQKQTKPIKVKKAKGSAQQMDISQSADEDARDCITINEKADYVEYGPKIFFKKGGRTYEVITREVK
jgi:hypothetical protein